MACFTVSLLLQSPSSCFNRSIFSLERLSHISPSSPLTSWRTVSRDSRSSSIMLISFCKLSRRSLVVLFLSSMMGVNFSEPLANLEAISSASFMRTTPFPALTDFARSARSLSNLRNSSLPVFLSAVSYKGNYTKILQLP